MTTTTLIHTQLTAPNLIENSIEAINAPLAQFLQHCHLPTQDILASVEERTTVIQAFERVISILPIPEREKATYISKFAISIAVGLFDGALSFLWDETILALRKKIESFDIEYFYNIASTINTRYKGLIDSQDLPAIGDHDLLEISRRIGLIDDMNHRRLDQVNYFRNHGSAAHPNNTSLSGFEMLGFLETCLKYAICADFDVSVIQVKRLLDNIRKGNVDPADYTIICEEIIRLPQERIDDILNTIFGMHHDPKIASNTINNILGIAPTVWKASTHPTKLRLGAKFGYFRVNGETVRKDRVQNFLDSVDGNSYKDEDSLSQELIEKLQHLRSSHYAGNNFYNEYPYAESLKASLTPVGIPKAVQYDFVKVVSTCAIGNGLGYRQGVDERALPIYEELINRFGDDEIIIFCKLFEDHEFIGDFGKTLASTRAKSLAAYLKNRTHNVLIQNALNEISNAHNLPKLGLVTTFKTALSNIT
jgi:hypothetical protein